jgi:hypothetical protein
MERRFLATFSKLTGEYDKNERHIYNVFALYCYKPRNKTIKLRQQRSTQQQAAEVGDGQNGPPPQKVSTDPLVSD